MAAMFCIAFLNMIFEAEEADQYIGFFVNFAILFGVLGAMLWYLSKFADRVRVLVSHGTYLPDFWWLIAWKNQINNFNTKIQNIELF